MILQILLGSSLHAIHADGGIQSDFGQVRGLRCQLGDASGKGKGGDQSIEANFKRSSTFSRLTLTVPKRSFKMIPRSFPGDHLK